MLTELCGYLKNWFTVDRYFGGFAITDNTITYADGSKLPLQSGQYFRVIGSIFNDGVHCYNEELTLKAEQFCGSVWAMAVPNEVITLANDIKAWRDKYEGSDSAAMSPYNSESFGGYSYSKSNSEVGISWQNAFRNKLSRYKKV